jgi:hypothetical protein
MESIRFKTGRQALKWGNKPTQPALINWHATNADRLKKEVKTRNISRNLLVNQIVAEYFEKVDKEIKLKTKV